MDLTKKAFFADNNSDFANRKREKLCFLREHFYTDQSGKRIAVKKIYTNQNGKKEGYWYKVSNDIVSKKAGLNGEKMPLYHLHKLINYQDIIYIVEGEKDVETLERINYTATTTPHGASEKYWETNFNIFFDNRNIIIIKDNNIYGKQYADFIVSKLVGIAKNIRIINPVDLYAELKDKGDISDVVEAIGIPLTKKRLTEAVSKTEPITKLEDIINDNGNDTINKIIEIKPNMTSEWKDAEFITLFANVYKEECRFNSTVGEWFIFNGKKWEIDNNSLFTLFKADIFRNELMNYTFNNLKSNNNKESQVIHNMVVGLGDENKRQTIVKGARDRHPIKNSDFDKDGNLFNCQNGTIDLNTFAFTEHNHNDLLSKISNVVYDENAKCERWEKFIDEVMQGDKEKIKYLQTILGYSLTTRTELETCFIFYGNTTRNGKSTLTETIIYLMGDYARNMLPQTLAKKKNGDSRQANGDIARLNGCRLVNASEPPKNMLFDVALLKTLLGNDTITARELYQKEFEFKPYFKLFINTNYLPTVTDKTLFESGRINVITFDKHFNESDQDSQLKKKLTIPEEISGIFNWLLEGLKNFFCESAKPPVSVIQVNEDYKNQNDKIKNFIEDCLQYKPNYFCKLKNVYFTYEQWCKQNILGIDRKNFLQRNCVQEILSRTQELSMVKPKRML